MFIQINTDNQVASDSERDARLEEQVKQRLARFEDRITDVEILVFEQKAASDMRCTLEARMAGVPPVAVADNGATVDRAVLNAAKKAARALDHQVGKISDTKGH